MRRAVLADTGPLYAAVDPDDAHHQRAHRELQRLARDKREVLVAYPTLLKAYTLVLFRLGKTVSSRWLTDLAQGAALIVAVGELNRKLGVLRHGQLQGTAARRAVRMLAAYH